MLTPTLDTIQVGSLSMNRRSREAPPKRKTVIVNSIRCSMTRLKSRINRRSGIANHDAVDK
jgi:hypothetical protein